MKTTILKAVMVLLTCTLCLSTAFAQIPQAINFQAIARDAQSNPMVNTNIQIRLSVLDNSAEGTVVYQELRALQTNTYGSFSFQIGVGANFVTNEGGTFEEIAWETGNKFLKIDYDPSNTFTFTLTLGTIEFVSVPYAFAAETVVFIDATGAVDGDILVYNEAAGKFVPGQVITGSVTWENVQDKPSIPEDISDLTDNNGVLFDGNYNSLTNAPIINGSETSIVAGANVTISGNGTASNPYMINSSGQTTVQILSSQTFTVPQGASKIKVELWGGAGGGGGAGMNSYSFNFGGNGGSGGYSQQEIVVNSGDQFNVTIGTGGFKGGNATGYSNGYGIGDTNGENGEDTWFGSYRAAGGSGGKRGGYSYQTTNGASGTNNYGSITAYSSVNGSNVLDVFQGLSRSYLVDRSFTSKPGIGGQYIAMYSISYEPSSGENGSALITIF